LKKSVVKKEINSSRERNLPVFLEGAKKGLSEKKRIAKQKYA